MRLNNDSIQPSLQMCEQLGSGAAPDCSQGVYHDYWFAVNGLDATTKPKDAVTDPRELCGAQPQEFVRTCWYRAFVETREAAGAVETPEDVERLCGGLDGLQRAACVTGAIVIGPPDPRGQLAVCDSLAADTDIAACIRGTKVQNLINYPDNLQLELIKDCSQFRGTMSLTCYRWLGKTLGVLSDGKFRHHGLPRALSRRRAPRVRRGREEHGGPARDLLLSVFPSAADQRLHEECSLPWTAARSGSHATRSPRRSSGGCSSRPRPPASAAGPSWSRWPCTPTRSAAPRPSGSPRSCGWRPRASRRR